MLMKNLVCMCLLCLSLAARAEVIELRDGTRLTGRIGAVDDSTYTIISPSMGEIRVDRGEVVRIEQDSTATGLSASDSSLQSMQATIAANPAMMQAVMALSQDPEVQAILAEPEIMQAINRGDMQAVMNNARVRRLMENPQVQSLSREVQGMQ